jgi:hypothetical protein
LCDLVVNPRKERHYPPAVGGSPHLPLLHVRGARQILWQPPQCALFEKKLNTSASQPFAAIPSQFCQPGRQRDIIQLPRTHTATAFFSAQLPQDALSAAVVLSSSDGVEPVVLLLLLLLLDPGLPVFVVSFASAVPLPVLWVLDPAVGSVLLLPLLLSSSVPGAITIILCESITTPVTGSVVVLLTSS